MNPLDFLFDTKYSKYPMFLQYVDCTHRINGEDYFNVRKVLQSGDILLRGHDNYLSNFIIPGKYSHSGIYIGHDRLIHSTLDKGVHEDNLVDFMRCDRFMALRPRRGQVGICVRAHEYIGREYDKEIEDGDDEYYCHEFVASVLNDCAFGIEKIHAKALLGLLQRDVYCADSFIDNCFLIKFLEIDWKQNKAKGKQ